MNHSFLQIRTVDGLCDAYMSAPRSWKNLPGVILNMDAFGLRPRLCQMADRLASEGYVVLAPNLFYRSGPAPLFDYDHHMKPENFPQFFSLIRPIAMQLTPEHSTKDNLNFIKVLREQPGINPHRLGTVGYCMGGGIALRTAGNYPDDIQAAASFHAGGLVTDLPTSPHLWFPKIKAEVYVAHADQDASMLPEQIAKVSDEFNKASLRFKAEIYQGCKHGWTMSDVPVHDAAGEDRHWRNLFALFERTLKR